MHRATWLFPLLLPALFAAPPASAHPEGADVARSPFERHLLKSGFADVQQLDPTIRVELKYACDKNFMGVNVYGDFTRGYLREDAARKLARANALLKKIDPRLTILLADGLRPRHVQRKMWAIVRDTPMHPYVADPRTGSMHNYGCAVDVTLADENGDRLDMGTPLDHFGPLAQPRLEEQYLKEGKLSAEHVANRRLLRKVMVEAGFHQLPIEWWHFDAFEKARVRKTYTIVE